MVIELMCLCICFKQQIVTTAQPEIRKISENVNEIEKKSRHGIYNETENEIRPLYRNVSFGFRG